MISRIILSPDAMCQSLVILAISPSAQLDQPAGQFLKALRLHQTQPSRHQAICRDSSHLAALAHSRNDRRGSAPILIWPLFASTRCKSLDSRRENPKHWRAITRLGCGLSVGAWYDLIGSAGMCCRLPSSRLAPHAVHAGLFFSPCRGHPRPCPAGGFIISCERTQNHSPGMY